MPGYAMTKDQYTARLRRIEGQVRGLQRLVDEEAYCIDVLTQIASVTKALQGVGMGLLDEHIRHCVREAAGADDNEAFDAKVHEVTTAVSRMLRT
jgi:CsoR family transcriptional regulator, copper-sensing transcriptional repressor